MILSEPILRPGRVFLVSLALVAIGSTSPGADQKLPPIDSPQPAVRQYLAALKNGDLDAAMKLTAAIKDLPKSQIRQGLSSYSKTLREQEVESKIHDARATKDCAVVIIEQIRPKHRTQPSLMPVMLIRQGDDWKVLPRLNAGQRKTALTETQLGSVKALGKWFYQKIGEIETRSRDEYGKQLPIEAKSLIGAWSRAESGILTLLNFDKAGDFEEVVITQGKLTARLTGKWSVSDKTLKLAYNETEAGGAKSVPDQRISAIMRNILGLEARGEGKRIWQRVPEERRRKLLDELKK